MFREMRRKNQLLTLEENEEILKRSTSGVLSVMGDEDYPYTVPLSFIYTENKIYFHSAITGHKIDAIEKNNKVSFCVIDKDVILPEKFTTCFQSVIVFGRAYIVDDEKEIKTAIIKLAEKYSPTQSSENIKEEFYRWQNKFIIIRLDIEHITGKQGIELIKHKKNTDKNVTGNSP